MGHFALQDFRQRLIIHAAINAGIMNAPACSIHCRDNPYNVGLGGDHDIPNLRPGLQAYPYLPVLR